MANRGQLSLRHAEMFDIRKESSETRSEANISKCLKLNRPRLRLMSVLLVHGFLQRGLLSFRPRQVANQIAGFQSIIFLLKTKESCVMNFVSIH